MLAKPIKEMDEKLINQGIIKLNSTSKIKYNKPIKKYCKSKIEFHPKGSKPHSYCDVFSNKFLGIFFN